jgi:predicted metal-binding membrane protein
MWGRAQNQRVVATLLAALCALAWLALWLWGQSPYSRFLSHHSLAAGSGKGTLVVVFLAGWLLMTIAMMLPTSLPLIMLFHTLTRRRADQFRLVGLLIVGYLSVWTIVGGLLYLGDWGLHLAVERSAWLQAHLGIVGALLLVLAGVYQFSPLKYRCLDACRSPLSFITAHWRGSAARWQAFWLGADHGRFCVGCCWSLMVVMFAVGAGNLGWMLLLGAAMAVEKNLAWGRRLAAPLGVGLLGWGLVLLLGDPAAHPHLP